MDNIKIHKDTRGSLFALDFSKVPFAPKRFFSVFDVPVKAIRGGHAHLQCLQYLLCIEGQVVVNTNDGTKQETINLTEGRAILIDKMVWATQRYMTGKDILIVLCSEEYDETDYIKDFSEFKKKLCVI